MNQKVNPVVAVVLGIIAVVAVGFLSLKFFGGGAKETPVEIKATNPDDPKFKPDPKLAGGGG